MTTLSCCVKQLQILPREGKDLCTHCNGLGVNQATHPFYTPSLCLRTCLCVRVFVFVKDEECIWFFFLPRVTLPRGDSCIFIFLFFQAHTLLKLWTNLTQTGNAAKSLTESLKSPSALYWGHDKKKKWGWTIEKRKVVYQERVGRAGCLRGNEIDLHGHRKRAVCVYYEWHYIARKSCLN